MNKPYDFSKFYIRLQIILTEDFPHRDDMLIILDTLKTYVEPISSAANNHVCNIDIHYQCLPLTCLQVGYMNLSIEAMQIGTADTTLLELNLRLLKSTNSVVSLEMMHLYLLGIYYLRHDLVLAEKFGISQQTVIRRIATICEKVGVNNKKELIDYLRNNM